MPFRANNKQLLRNYNKIWEKVEQLMRIGFESNPVCGDDDKYIKTKICAGRWPPLAPPPSQKKSVPWKCLSIIMLDPVIKANKKYCPQTLLEEYKYVQEKIKSQNHIDYNLDKSESDSDSNDEIEFDINNDE